MRIRLWSVAAVITAATFVLSGTAFADPSSEQSQAEQDLAEAEATLEGATEAAREAARLVAEAEEDLPGARTRADEARGITAAAQIEADSAEQEAQDARDEYTQAESEYTTAEDEVDVARTELTDLATSFYQGAELVAVSAILDARNPIEAAERIGYVQRIVAEQREAVDAVTVLRQEAKVAQNAADVAKEAAEVAEAAAAEALETAEAEQAIAEAAEAEVQALVDQRADALDVAEAEKEASLALYEEAAEASEQIASSLQDTGSGDKKWSSGDTATLLMPVSGWKSSDFGNRYDPYYNVWQLHAGTDFAASGGTGIYAADSGTVAQAGWNGGYGNYTCLYHGDNVSTCYAHQSSIGVAHGQYVSRGDRIGSVGTTGASTGNHLHFEVRVNGNPVQPLDWLPACLC